MIRGQYLIPPMKPQFACLSSIICLAFSPFLCAQSAPSLHPARPDSDAQFASPPAVARFVPPAQPAPLKVANVTHRASFATPNGSLTLEKITPPTTISAAAKTSKPAIDPAQISKLRAERLAWRNAHPHLRLSLSATVYDDQYSHLRWWYDNQEYQAWSNLDFTLLRGVSSVLQGSTTYDVFLIAENRSTRSIPAAIRDRRFTQPKLPEIPELPATPAFIVTVGETSNQAAIAAIQALHDLYLKERPALENLRRQRAQYLADYNAWMKAHPPAPEHITLRYWENDPYPDPSASDQSGQAVPATNPAAMGGTP